MKITSIEDLNALIENQVAESKEFEYKEQLILASQTDKIKFLNNLTSFSNSIGGNLIYGIKAKDGIPIEIIGIDINSNDALALQLDNIIRDLTEPKVNEYNFTFLPISESKQVLVIDIRKSWNSPHAVKVNKGYIFYSRTSAGKTPLDIFEIRNLFLESSNQIDNARSFRIKRITEILSDQTPVMLNSTLPSKLVVHIIPLNSFNPASNYDLTKIKDTLIIEPLIHKSFTQTLNFEGLLLSSNYWNDYKTSGNYMQLYRNGIVEAVDLFSVNYIEQDTPKLSLGLIESEIKQFIERVFDTYKIINIPFPVIIGITFLSIKGKLLSVDMSRFIWFNSKGLGRDNYFIPEILIESGDEDWKTKFDEALLPMWNAFGTPKRL